MKLKNMLIIFAIFFMILCIGCVSAAENNSELSIDDGDIAIESENTEQPPLQEVQNPVEIGETNSSSDTNTNTDNSAQTQQTTSKTKAYILATTDFIKKSNKKFKIKVCTVDNAKKKLIFHKNVKVTVKVKIGKTTKTYNVKTNSKGLASIFNVKKLKAGHYKVTITSNDDRYTINDGGYITVYNKKQKTVTLKTNKMKKVKGDFIDNYYNKKNGQIKKGIYASSYNAKDPEEGIPHTMVLKAKFFFKNTKTGKIKTKTVKTKDDSKYLLKEFPYTKLIKGYKPIKTKIWYVTV